MSGTDLGSVTAIERFPVKSMQGESLEQVGVEAGGIPGDRTHGVLDVSTGKVASAKDPRKWAGLLSFRAEWLGEPGAEGALAITLPDGERVTTGDAGLDARLSVALGRDVQLRSNASPETGYDYVWEGDGVAPDDVISATQTDTTSDGQPVSTMSVGILAPGTFQDVAPITLLTTASLAAMRAHYPAGSWQPARFRSNLLLAVDGEDLVENGWQGRRLVIGEVELAVISPAPRCVMTTLPQLDLGRDREILQTIARHNRVEVAGGMWACLGAYAQVVSPGGVTVGDRVSLLPDGR
jgi:uncharacterized protein YcbX